MVARAAVADDCSPNMPLIERGLAMHFCWGRVGLDESSLVSCGEVNWHDAISPERARNIDGADAEPP